MIATLAAIAQDAPERDNVCLGTRILREQRETKDDQVPPALRVGQLRTLALLELGAGENERALDALARAAALIDQLPESERRAARAELEFWRGVQAMRVGETRNCVAQHSSESCLVPLRDAGVHADKEPGRRAIARFTEALALAPEGSWIGPCSRWLLNIAYMTVGEYPAGVPPALRIAFESEEPFPRFPDVAEGAAWPYAIAPAGRSRRTSTATVCSTSSRRRGTRRKSSATSATPAMERSPTRPSARGSRGCSAA